MPSSRQLLWAKVVDIKLNEVWALHMTYAWFLWVALLHVGNCSASAGCTWSACNCCTCTSGASKIVQTWLRAAAAPQQESKWTRQEFQETNEVANLFEQLEKVSKSVEWAAHLLLCPVTAACCSCCCCCLYCCYVWTLENKLINCDNNKRRHDDDVVAIAIAVVVQSLTFPLPVSALAVHIRSLFLCPVPRRLLLLLLMLLLPISLSMSALPQWAIPCHFELKTFRCHTLICCPLKAPQQITTELNSKQFLKYDSFVDYTFFWPR